MKGAARSGDKKLVAPKRIVDASPTGLKIRELTTKAKGVAKASAAITNKGKILAQASNHDVTVNIVSPETSFEDTSGFVEDPTQKRPKEANVLLRRFAARSNVQALRRLKDQVVTVAETAENIRAAVKLQSWFRMMLARRFAQRMKSGLFKQIRNRMIVERTDQNLNPLIRSLQCRTKVRLLRSDWECQMASSCLQAAVLQHQATERYHRIRPSLQLISSAFMRIKQSKRFRLEQAVETLKAQLMRFLFQPHFAMQRSKCVILQGYFRKISLPYVLSLKRERYRETFRRAYRTHKYLIMSLVRRNRATIQRLQANIRCALSRVRYLQMLKLTRDAVELRKRRRESAALLSSKARTVLVQRSFLMFCGKVHFMQTLIHSRKKRDEYVEYHEACQELFWQFRAISIQIRASRIMRIPLLRLVQARPLAQDAVALLQSHCRVWCMEALGQESYIDFHHDLRPRLHLSLFQKSEAAIQLQALLRMNLASSKSENLRWAGYSSVLSAGNVLQAFARGSCIRQRMLEIMRRYAVMSLQSRTRMRMLRLKYSDVVQAWTHLKWCKLRISAHANYIKGFRAQKTLQAFARMRAVPSVSLLYSRMPTRQLARMLQARIRMEFARTSYIETRASIIEAQRFLKRSVHRLIYMELKVCYRKSKNAHDFDKMFARILARNPRRNVRGGYERLPRGTLTVHKQMEIENKARHALIEQRLKATFEHQQSGLLLQVEIPTASMRIVHKGRLMQVVNSRKVVLDWTFASPNSGEYRNFFLTTNIAGSEEKRRIIEYLPHGLATVWPPFSSRPTITAKYGIEDLQDWPVEPNLAQIFHKRENRAIVRLQCLIRCVRARREFSNRKEMRCIELKREAEVQWITRMNEEEKERARQQRLRDEEARRQAIAEGRRLFYASQARIEEEERARKDLRKAQLERLWGVKVVMPPQRPAGADSPRRGLHLAGPPHERKKSRSPKKRQKDLAEEIVDHFLPPIDAATRLHRPKTGEGAAGNVSWWSTAAAAAGQASDEIPPWRIRQEIDENVHALYVESSTDFNILDQSSWVV